MDIRLIFLNLNCFVLPCTVLCSGAWLTWGMTEDDNSGILMIWCLNNKLVLARKSAKMKASYDENSEFIEGNQSTLSFREKCRKESAFRQQEAVKSVPQTDTGRLVEYTKAIGRKRLKELGKTAGRNLWEMPCQIPAGIWPQRKTLADCLSKTQVSAKPKGNV